MRVVALLAVRNEENYMEICIEYLCAQGIDICLIDNESTDRTLNIAKKYLNRGVFRIVSLPFNGIFEWLKILKVKSELSREIEADWFIHHDADEIREPPRRFNNLVEAIKEVDKAGYNAINSIEFVFIPTAEESSFEGTDYYKEMKYYYYFSPRPLHRVNIWKKTDTNIDLAHSGGHNVEFEGRLIYPEEFILRHYIVLSKNHAAAKYGSRIYDPRELAIGMNVKRAAFVPNTLKLPSRSELKQITQNSEWVLSNPWTEHLLFRKYN